MPVSKAQQKAVNKYMKTHYDRIVINVPKGKKAVIKAAADAAGQSMNEYCVKAIMERVDNS